MEAVASRGLRILLISTRAGNVGINLMGASHVILFDASWNPANDAQAVFRAYRFGQTRPVHVYRFVAAGTLESSIHKRQVNKVAMSQRVLDDSGVARQYRSDQYERLELLHDHDGAEKQRGMDSDISARGSIANNSALHDALKNLDSKLPQLEVTVRLHDSLIDPDSTLALSEDEKWLMHAEAQGLAVQIPVYDGILPSRWELYRRRDSNELVFVDTEASERSGKAIVGGGADHEAAKVWPRWFIGELTDILARPRMMMQMGVLCGEQPLLLELFDGLRRRAPHVWQARDQQREQQQQSGQQLQPVRLQQQMVPCGAGGSALDATQQLQLAQLQQQVGPWAAGGPALHPAAHGTVLPTQMPPALPTAPHANVQQQGWDSRQRMLQAYQQQLFQRARDDNERRSADTRFVPPQVTYMHQHQV